MVVGEVDLRFADEVIAPLLGEELVVKMERVQVGSGFLESLKFFMQEGKVRPREREEEDEVDQHAGYIVLTEDLVSGDGVLAIEIKVSFLHSSFLITQHFLFHSLTYFAQPSSRCS